MSDYELNVACPACGWTASKQKCCSYSSHVTLFYGAGDRGVWSLGSDLILKERPNLPPKIEVHNIEFLKQHTTIPVPSVLKEWVDDSNRYFILMDRIKGQTLEEVWSTLSGLQKGHIAEQVAEYIQQLRHLQSPAMQSLNGGPLYSSWLFLDAEGNPYGPLRSDIELQDSLALALKELPRVVSARFKARLPVCTPYTFTHGDLNCQNIIVKNGELLGILDWESAGYFPVWWEYAATSIGLSAEDADWKALLRERLCAHSTARDFWRNFYSLSNYPDLDEKGQSLFRSLLEEKQASCQISRAGNDQETEISI